MRITKYQLEKPNILVKESALNYDTDIKNLDNPTFIVNLLNDIFKLDKQAEEHIYMLAINTKGKLLGVFEVFHGTVNTSLISSREIFIRALLCGATNIIIVHNHPSGDPTPSKQDLDITKTIKKAGEIINIPLLDHIIVGDGEYYSFGLMGTL